MSVVPRTLFWRNLLLIAALIAFAQTAGALAFLVFVTLPRVEPFIGYARQHADSIVLALHALPAQARHDYLAVIDRIGPARVIDADAAPDADAMPFDAPRRLAIVAFMRELRTRLPAGYRLGWQAGPRIVWIGVPDQARRVWVGFPAAGMVPNLGPSTAVSAAGAGLLALLGAYLIQRRIDRPMRALLAASRAVGAGRPPPVLDEGGPAETAALAHAFNAMARELDTQERERALMLAGVSHDLRTPLAKIRLALELIGPAAEPALRASIERSVDNANRVIDQFIDFGRGAGQEAVEPIDLDALARAVAADAGTAHAGDITVDAGCPAPLPLRPRAMRRLLANLVDNALKYAGPPVLIRTRATAGEIKLSVVDRGPGIPDADAARLMRPFARGGAARDGLPGAGLGLAIVERIARLHGGHATLLPATVDRARPGLEVRVTLPRAT